MGFFRNVGKGIRNIKNKAAEKWGDYNEATDRDIEGQGERKKAAEFADARRAAFDRLGGEASAERDYTRKIARGEESVSKIQLQQALQQNQATQQSMAAGARPANAAMAARQAAMNAGRQGAGLAGQQSIAGIQERQAASSQLAQSLQAQRQQELQGALQSGSQANPQGDTGPTKAEKGMDMAKSAAMIYAASDERLKKNVTSGDADAERTLKALKSVKYDYKDQEYGKGEQLGITAQGLEKAGLPGTVHEMGNGKKAVHGAKLAAALTSMMPGINDRLEVLESKGKKAKGKGKKK